MSADPCNCWNCRYGGRHSLARIGRIFLYMIQCTFYRIPMFRCYDIIAPCIDWQLDPRWYADHLAFIHNGDVEVAL